MKYKNIQEKILFLKEKCENLSIGKSLLGEDIICFHVGSKAGKQIVVEGGIHAREYISTLFLLSEIEYLTTKRIEGGMYIIPLLNPDGVRLVLDGASFISDQKLKNFLIDINCSDNFSLWKANANAVDLNVNFDVFWGQGKQNVRHLAPANFIGYYANSEIENINFLNFLKTINFNGSLSFHSKGEVIYYGFMLKGERLKKEKQIVKVLSKINGYKPVKTKNSMGGLSDYLSYYYKVPAFTVELGSDLLNHPITERFLPEIFQKNKQILTSFLNLL